MNERPLKKNQVIQIHISDYAFGGVGIGKVATEKGEFTVFVQNTLPGQFVMAQVEKCDKRYAECRLLEVITPSPDEIDNGFQAIPGAPYATLPIELQREYKKRSTLEQYKRIGKIANIEELFDVMIDAPSTWHYRNKMEYSFSAIRYDFDAKDAVDEFSLGFKHRGTWWMVENLDKDSGMFDAQLENGLKTIREYCEKTGLPAWHPPKREGFYRFLVARKSYLTDQLLINLVTSDLGINDFDINAFANMMRQVMGDRLAGFIHTINPDIGDRVDPLNGSTHLVFGDSKIVEELNGLKFEISMQSFFQTNPKCAALLYDKVIEYVTLPAENASGTFIMDLFCGTGTISQLLAKGTSQKIVGVDIVASSIADAKKNAERNGVTNCTFHAADAGKFLNEFPEYEGKLSTIVLDPPRAGIAPKTLKKVMLLGAPRIVYVSCNPSTQARDAEMLQEAGYELKKISLVDQFPHTSHIEAVALFEKRK